MWCQSSGLFQKPPLWLSSSGSFQRRPFEARSACTVQSPRRCQHGQNLLLAIICFLPVLNVCVRVLCVTESAECWYSFIVGCIVSRFDRQWSLKYMYISYNYYYYLHLVKHVFYVPFIYSILFVQFLPFFLCFGFFLSSSGCLFSETKISLWFVVQSVFVSTTLDKGRWCSVWRMHW